MVSKRDAFNNFLTGILIVSLFVTYSSQHADDMCQLTVKSAYYYQIEGYKERHGFSVKIVDMIRTFFEYIDPIDYQLCNDYGLVTLMHGCYEYKGYIPEPHEMDKDTKLAYLWVNCVDRYHGDKLERSTTGIRHALETCLIQVNDLLPFLDPCLSTRKMDKYHECFVSPNITTT